MKSGGVAAHEDLDAINMAIRKQTACFKLAAGSAAPCFVNEQSNSQEQEDFSS